MQTTDDDAINVLRFSTIAIVYMAPGKWFHHDGMNANAIAIADLRGTMFAEQ
jgi:hypothetical protein